MKRTFASLGPQEALQAAICIEERNAGIYQRFAEMFVEFRDNDSLEIASVFWDMAVEEKHHGALLRGTYTERYGETSCLFNEEELYDFIEVPRLEDGDVFALIRDNSRSVARARALQVALTAEVSAQKFYADLAERTDEQALRRLYRELAEMEDGHVAYIERKLQPHAVTDKSVN